jgi:hypothetical protein
MRITQKIVHRGKFFENFEKVLEIDLEKIVSLGFEIGIILSFSKKK